MFLLNTVKTRYTNVCQSTYNLSVKSKKLGWKIHYEEENIYVSSYIDRLHKCPKKLQQSYIGAPSVYTSSGSMEVRNSSQNLLGYLKEVIFVTKSAEINQWLQLC
jgi:hypothetical protein